MCRFSRKKIETLTHAIWDTNSYDFVFVPEPSRTPSKIQDLYKSMPMPYLFIGEFKIFCKWHLKNQYLSFDSCLLTNYPGWHSKIITHAECWESQLSNGIRVWGSSQEAKVDLINFYFLWVVRTTSRSINNYYRKI